MGQYSLGEHLSVGPAVRFVLRYIDMGGGIIHEDRVLHQVKSPVASEG
jgi:hypothetical protein